MGIGLGFLLSFLGTHIFFLLCLARRLLPLLLRKLFSFEHSLPILRLLEVSFLLRCQLLLLKLLLRSRCCFCAEVLQFLLFFCQAHLSLLIFEDCLDFCLLHAADVGDEGTVADVTVEHVVVHYGASCDGTEV